MNEGMPVLLTITGINTEGDGAGEDPVKLTTRGTIRSEGLFFLLEYDESQIDEGDGSVTTQHIQLKIFGDRVEMTRMGDFATTMVFVKDQRFEGAYRTPYGSLSMAVFSTLVQVVLKPTNGFIHLKYQLEVQGQYSGMHDLKLEYRLIRP